MTVKERGGISQVERLTADSEDFHIAYVETAKYTQSRADRAVDLQKHLRATRLEYFVLARWHNIPK